MRKFEVCIRGTNFRIKGKDGKTRKNGFYAARFVEANDISTAVEKTIASFRADLKEVVMNSDSDPPAMKVEEADEVYYFQDSMDINGLTVPGEGFIWDKVEEAVEEEIVKPISAWKGGWSNFRQSYREKDKHPHTILIHFTNALYPMAVLFMFLFLLSGKVSFQQTHFYMMLLATVSVPFSYLTGFLEWKRKHQGAMIPLFITKLRYGAAVFVIGACCTVWHVFSPGVLTDNVLFTLFYVVLNLALLPPLVYLGHLGGLIVYEGVD